MGKVKLRQLGVIVVTSHNRLNRKMIGEHKLLEYYGRMKEFKGFRLAPVEVEVTLRFVIAKVATHNNEQIM